MRPLLHACVGAALLWAAPARAHHVDPFEVVNRAFETYQKNDDYGEVRAIFSEALREAPHDGRLSPDFGLLFAVYSDTVRFDGNPSFALLLAEEGLALVNSAAEPDIGIRNALTVSRAYALADLGRYREAIDTATIAALWLEERFGKENRDQLEAEIRNWADKADGAGDDLPSAATIAVDLLSEAEKAILANDTGRAIDLASRAMLPDASGLSDAAMRMVNSWSLSVTGAAYAIEGRHATAVTSLRRAVDLLAAEPWPGTGKAELLPELVTDLTPKTAWDAFIRLAASAVFINDLELADAALLNAAEHARSPGARFSLLVQRANLLMRSDDHDAVEALLRESETEALAAGDLENAALSRFYVAVVRMRREKRAPDAPEVAHMLRSAREAANAARSDATQAEYILANAARLAVDHAAAFEAALPVARDAFAAFRDRQRALGGYEQGQESARRDRRRFLETYVDVLFETGH